MTQWLLAILVLTAGGYDLRTRRIPNWLVLVGLLTGIAVNVTVFEWEGLRASLLGMGLAALIDIPLYALRAMGAGDAKLMMAVGAMVGPGPWFAIFILTSILGGVGAVSILLWRKGLGRSLGNVGTILSSLLRMRAPYHDNPELDVRNERAVRLPHGAVIAMGTILFLSAGKLLSKF